MEKILEGNIEELLKVNGRLLGHNIRQQRKAKGITQIKLSETARISLRQLKRIEQGAFPNPRTQTALALALNIPPYRLLNPNRVIALHELTLKSDRLSSASLSQIERDFNIFKEHISSIDDVLFGWDIERQEKSGIRKGFAVLCAHPELYSLNDFILQDIKGFDDVFEKTATAIAGMAYKYEPWDIWDGSHIGLIKCRIRPFRYQEHVGVEASRMSGILESRALYGTDDLMLIWRGDSEDEFNFIVHNVAGLTGSSVTLNAVASISQEAKRKFQSRSLMEKHYSYVAFARPLQDQYNGVRLQVRGHDGFPLPWDLVIKGNVAREIYGSTIVIRVFPKPDIKQGGAESVPRDDPWD